MTACGFVLILTLCIFTISYCQSDLPDTSEATVEEPEHGNKVDPSEDKHIVVIIILSVCVCILSMALIVTCTFLFLQRRQLIRHTGTREPNSQNDLPNLEINPGADNAAFANEVIQEDSDRGTPPQGRSDNFTWIEEAEGLDDRTDNQPRLRSSTLSHDELSEVVTNDQPNDPHSLRRTSDEDENIRGHSEQCDSNATVTDDKHSYQNLDKYDKLIPNDESELAEAGLGAGSTAGGGAEGGTKAKTKAKIKHNPYDNVIIPKGVPLINSSKDDGEYIKMTSVQRTKDTTLCVPPSMPESPSSINNSNLPHFGLEEDRSGSGK